MKAVTGGNFTINGTFSGVATAISGGTYNITNGEFYDERTE